MAKRRVFAADRACRFSDVAAACFAASRRVTSSCAVASAALATAPWALARSQSSSISGRTSAVSPWVSMMMMPSSFANEASEAGEQGRTGNVGALR